jgi:hypothetical protein
MGHQFVCRLKQVESENSSEQIPVRAHPITEHERDESSEVGRSRRMIVENDRVEHNRNEKVYNSIYFRAGSNTANGSRYACRPESGACDEAHPLPSSRRHARPA